MNQQQLQNARTALWRQSGQPMLTQDEAASWLDDIGFCLFLPRHAQLPAPAPSFVEACSGEARAVPAAPAIDAAMALVIRLVGEGRAVPLNLMGNLTEQPDFLATPEALRWVAAVRGDRNWKAAPGGRTAPLVQRVWAALDHAPGRTAVEIREELGRELTEAAVMRALVELWTTLRAAPEYIAGEPARWSLMKDRYQADMAAGANTAQTTALSALISLYLRQAVAATAEEAEIFLSPLTARSRIREVLHGMLATRQFGTMPLGVQTLLYLEGTLPEAPEEEAAQTRTELAGEAAPERPERTRERKPWTEKRPESRPGARPPQRREPQRSFARGPRREGPPQRGERREFDRGEKRPFRPGQKPQQRFGSKPGEGREERREFRRPGGKPWEKREGSGGPRRSGQPGREFGQRREGQREFRGERKQGGWRAPRREERENRGPENRPRENQPREIQSREEGRPEQREFRPQNRREFRPATRERGQGRREFHPENRGSRQGRPEFRGAGPGKPRFERKPPQSGGQDQRPAGTPERPAERPPQRFGKPPAKFGRPVAKFGKPGSRFGKPGSERSGKPGGDRGRPGGSFSKPGGSRSGKPGGARFGKPGGKFGKPGPPRGDRPWKNRPDKNGPKGPRSGKNRKEQKDQPE